MRFGQMTPYRSRYPVSRNRREGEFDPFSALRSNFDEMLSEFFDLGSPLSVGGSEFRPSVDVTETDKQIVIKADLPGMDEKDVELEIDGDVLTLRGERSEEKEEGEGENRHIVERTYGRFERAMRLPFAPADKDVETSFKRGVLKVKLKKPKELETRARKIAINGE